MNPRTLFLLPAILITTACLLASCGNKKEKEGQKNEATEQTKDGERRPPEFVYDDLGNIIQRKDFTYDTDGNVRSKNQYDYKFDDRNNRIEEISQSWDFTGKRIVYTIARFKYDKFNLKSESIFTSYDPDGREIMWVKNVYEYSEYGYEIKDTQYNKEGIPLSMVTRKRDEKGRILEETSTLYNSDGSVKQANGAQYDLNGRILKSW